MTYVQKYSPDELNKHRRKRGMTYKQLSALTGMDAPDVCRLMKGHQVPRADTLARICSAMEMDPGDAYVWVEDE